MAVDIKINEITDERLQGTPNLRNIGILVIQI